MADGNNEYYFKQNITKNEVENFLIFMFVFIFPFFFIKFTIKKDG